MLKAEATWLGSQMARLTRDCSPLLNVGSSSAQFREQVQPWIEQLALAPARSLGISIIHQDLMPQDGVDIVGDLYDLGCQERVRARGIRSILCTSVLEHVVDRAHFARILEDLLPVGGRLLITVPHGFPYHPDPIDTMYRPTPSELAALFPRMQVVDQALVQCGRLHDLVLENPGRLKTRIKELVLGPRRDEASAGRAAAGTIRDWLIPWAYRPFELSCLHLLRRDEKRS